MYLHILGSNSMFTKEFYKLICERFPVDEHCFLGNFPDKNDYVGCKIVQSKSLKMPYYLYKADYIIVHGFFNKSVILAFALQPWLLRKSNWIIFGADIYSHQKSNMGYIEKIFEMLKKYTAPKFSFISTFSDGDWNLAKSWYNVKGINLKVSYPLAGCNTKLVSELHEEKLGKKNSTVNIIIGNSATDTNQHFQALKMLEKFKDEDIMIHLPLNYGLGDYKNYAAEVINYAIEIFGSQKIKPLTEKISGEDYLRYLNQMDVGLFNNNRQQAMGNITQLLLCGVKIYIRTDTNMWNHYLNLGIHLHDIDKISDYKYFNQLYEEDIQRRKDNVKAISARQDIELKFQIWDHIFKTMAKK